MKKTLQLFFTFFAATIFNGYAQNFYFGVNGGFLRNATIIQNNNSNLPPWNKERLNSLNWGVNLDYRLSEYWRMETQFRFISLVYYEQLSDLYHPSNTPGGWLPVEIDWYNKHYYMQIPLLVHYNFFPDQSKFGLSLFAGPNFGFRIKQTTEFIGVNEWGKDLASTLSDGEIPLKNFDFGLLMGLRLQSKPYRSFSIFIDGALNQGFSSIIDYPEQTHNGPPEHFEYYNIVNRHFTANIGVLYHLQ